MSVVIGEDLAADLIHVEDERGVGTVQVPDGANVLRGDDRVLWGCGGVRAGRTQLLRREKTEERRRAGGMQKHPTRIYTTQAASRTCTDTTPMSWDSQCRQIWQGMMATIRRAVQCVFGNLFRYDEEMRCSDGIPRSKNDNQVVICGQGAGVT
jgi:hypothetical protein